MYEEARKEGFYTVCFDMDDGCPGMELSDEGHTVSTKDASACIRAASEVRETSQVADRPLVGVVTCGADVEYTVAAIASACQLPGIQPEVAERVHNKKLMHRHLENVGLGRRKAALLSNGGNLPTDLAPWPVVVKPLSNCASRGVQIVRNDQEMMEAFRQAQRFSSRDDDVLIEEYLPGSKHTCEVIFAEDECLLVSIIDTHYISERYPCELGLNTTDLEESLQVALHQLTREIGHALGVDWGPFKADVNWDGEQFKLIECTARLSGGFHCQYATRTAFGTNEIRAVLQLATGERIDPSLVQGTRREHAAVRAAFPAPGKIRMIGLCESDTTSSPYLQNVDRVVLMKKKGDLLGPYRNSSDRGFFSLAHGQTLLEAVGNAEQGARHIEHNVETEPFDRCPCCGSENVSNLRGNIEEPLEFWCENCGECFYYFEARSVEMFDRAG
jgi:hypothetical protein